MHQAIIRWVFLIPDMQVHMQVSDIHLHTWNNPSEEMYERHFNSQYSNELSNNSKFKSYNPHFAFPQQQMLHVQEQMIESLK